MCECAKNGVRTCLCFNQIGEKALAIYKLNKKCIVVCKDIISQNMLFDTLTSLGKKVQILNTGYPMPVFAFGQENFKMCEFLSALYDYHLGKVDILLTLGESLVQKLPNIHFFDNYQNLKIGQNYNFTNFENSLTCLGYKRVESVSKIGEFCIRGDIVDIFPLNHNFPIRLDFFGDNLEKIYSYDIDTVEKIATLENVEIYPATFYLINEENKQQIEQKLNDEINKKINDNYLHYSEIKNYYENKINDNFIEIGDSFILPFFDFSDSVLSLFSNDLIIFDEPKKIFDDLIKILDNNNLEINNLIENNQLLPIHKNYFNSVENLLKINKYLIFDNYENNYLKYDEKIIFKSIGSQKYVFDFKALLRDIRIYLSSNYSVFLFCGDKNSKQNIGKFLQENNLSYVTSFDENSANPQIVLYEEILPYSASFLDCNVIIIGTFDLVKKSRELLSKNSNLGRLSQKKRKVFYLPKVGEYVVHEVHGIGKCVDLKKLNFSGVDKDYFIIEYKNGDILYVPSEQTNTLSAYLGSDKTPTVNKLGGQEFAKIKERVKNSVKELAIDLIKLYKQRETEKGHKYESGNYLMDIFENAFPFELTPDQQTAINDAKGDLYSGKLMDRLICGDVGYGKTEVALRVAYQVILEGKQVAFLCPTTILSEQHNLTAQKRFKDFGCRIQVLNRFRSKNEQTEILKGVKSGDVDMLIGTHRLLSNDVVFSNLGLLILDEEHRFGVADKEKIKNLKKDIDVLTLSATPIPRTLNMALSGIRDISIIETPPKNRLAVQTYVTEQSDSLIESATKRELSRGGQVLIVFNSVEKIYDFANKVRSLVPQAKIGVAHGQMNTKILEDVITKLYNREIDILISTTLIENGVDLPKANTLIVIDSDKLGLSQLYQLKGRIGRSDKMAYAYFTYNPNKVLTIDAYKRLDAIMEFTELGSGFKIAMRDLEIRGAGNILGKEQHGHMEKVGYDLYCKLLGEAVSELKGKKEKEVLPIKVDIICPAYIPENYIVEQDKVKFYAEISEIATKKDYLELKNKLTNTFGEVPSELKNLLKIALIKNLGIKMEAKRILLTSQACKIYLYQKEEILTQKIADILHKNKDIAVLKFEDVPIIELDILAKPMSEKLDFLINFLTDCTND